jgi:hypothetical protein
MTAHVCDDTAYPAAAMPDECTCEGEPMTDPTAAERINDYMASRAETAAELHAIIDSDTPADIDGYETDPEQAQDRLNEWPLSVEVIRHVKILLGTGGPADWLDAELDSENDIRTLYYHFADWFDHASVAVDKESPLWRFAESFVELVESDTERAAGSW